MLHRLAALALAAPLAACTSMRPHAEPEPFRVIVLENAVARHVAGVLADAFRGPDGPSARVVADNRTNSLIVMGDAEQIPQVLELIAALDRDVN